jgi:hypothetical protein
MRASSATSAEVRSFAGETGRSADASLGSGSAGKRAVGKELDMAIPNPQTRRIESIFSRDSSWYTSASGFLVQYIESRYNKRLLF